MKEKLAVFFIFLFAVFLFFHPVFLKGQIPFPGDILVGYAPWSGYSYDGYAPGGMPNKAQGIDVIRQLYPWKYLAMEMWKQKQAPLWNPYNFSGIPFLANFQTGAFYPLNIVFLLPFNIGWTVFIMLQSVLALIFTYLFLRNLKLSGLASAFGSIAFTFSLYMTVWIEYGNIGHTLLWLPLLLFLIDKLKEKFSARLLIVYSLVLTVSVLAGYIQQIIYMAAVCTLYFIFRHIEADKKKFGKKLLLFLLFNCLSFLIAAIQIIPTLEVFVLSARNIYQGNVLEKILAPWFYLVTLFAPDFFGNPAYRNYFIEGTYIERVSYLGVIPLIFVALIPKWQKTIKFFLILAVIVFLLGVYNPLSVFFYNLKIPIIGTTIPTRIFSLAGFSLAVLAAYGIDSYIKIKTINYKRISVLFLLMILLGITVFILHKFGIFGSNFFTVVKGMLLSSIFLIIGIVLIVIGSFTPKLKKIILILILIISVMDLYLYFNRLTPFSPQEYIYPKNSLFENLKKNNSSLWRYWGYGSAFIDTNFSSYEKIYSTDGNDPLFIRKYGEFVAASDNGELKTVIPRADVMVYKGFGMDDLKNNFFRKRALDILGVYYVINKDEERNRKASAAFPDDQYDLIGQESVWQIYRNKNALPRISLFNSYEIINNEKNIIKRLYDPGFDPHDTVILEEKPELVSVQKKITSNKLAVDSFQENKIQITIDLEAPQILMITDNYFPGWIARVDGKETKVYRADYTFRAVEIPQGRHIVEFSYEPQSFFWGRIITMVSLIIVLSLGLYLYITDKYDQNLVS